MYPINIDDIKNAITNSDLRTAAWIKPNECFYITRVEENGFMRRIALAKNLNIDIIDLGKLIGNILGDNDIYWIYRDSHITVFTSLIYDKIKPLGDQISLMYRFYGGFDYAMLNLLYLYEDMFNDDVKPSLDILRSMKSAKSLEAKLIC